jgi:hypothetical protein
MSFLTFWLGWAMGLGTGLYWAWLAKQIRDDQEGVASEHQWSDDSDLAGICGQS